jgi:acyl-coenzyme A synthetase/AMP-(fatty) acid ligase
MINSETGIKISGDHFPSPQILSDLIDVNRYGNFKLLGRHGDMIKIAGKRASLAGLNLMLSDLPGLTDGMFYLPTTSGITNRLVIIYSGMPYEKGEIVSWLRDRIDPAFLPRGIIRVDSLKRTENGKVARSVLDKIYSSWQSERVVNESS